MKGKMKSRNKGLMILLIVIIVILAYLAIAPDPVDSLDGYLGGEKIGLFEDQEFKNILEEDYRLEMNYKKSGSIDMVRADHTNMSYLFPASQTALELYKEEIGSPKRSEIILNTPLVFYTHTGIRDKLLEAGYIKEVSGSYYMDMIKFSQALNEKKTWADVGVTELYGNISVKTTDPTKSNSGNMFAGLLASSLNGGQVVDSNTIGPILPQLKEIFSSMGYMDTSSEDIFQQALKMGVGPIQ